MASQSLNITVEDSSPLITYLPAGSWTDSPNNDPLLSSYSGASYHTTSLQGATATFSFVGTGVSIFGAHRSNYGSYTASVDGQNISTGTSEASQSSTQQILASVAGLNYGPHTMVFTNTGGVPVDIDWVDFQTDVGQPGETVTRTDFDDGDPAMIYAPSPDAWQTNSNTGFFQNTLHFSQVPGASASMKFSGGAVALYGTVSPDHANIVVNIDGQESKLPGGANGFASIVHPDVLLYYRGDLGSSEHTITLSADTEQGTGPFIDLDKVTVFAAVGSADGFSSIGTVSATPSASTIVPSTVQASVSASATAAAETLAPSSSSLASTGTSNSHTSTGVIIGAVIGALAVLIMLGITAVLLCMRRRRQRNARVHKSMIAVSPVLPMQEKPMTPLLPMQRGVLDMEKGGMRGLENPAFPFPLPKKVSSLKYPTPSRYSVKSSYSTHTRGESDISTGSTAPLVNGVPLINAPQLSLSRKPTPGGSGQNTTGPVRPSNRPPTIDFAHISESPR